MKLSLATRIKFPFSPYTAITCETYAVITTVQLQLRKWHLQQARLQLVSTMFLAVLGEGCRAS